MLASKGVKMKEQLPFNLRFKKQLELDEKRLYILDSIRYRDGDLSVKSGAILAFSGLIIATAIVQLSTSPESVININKNEVFLILLNAIGLLLLFASSITNLCALISTGKYSDNAEDALLEFDDYVKIKSSRVKSSVKFAITGTVLVLLSLVIVLIRGAINF